MEDKKKAENDFKKHQELESEAAAALAEELVKSAGLEMPVFDILQQSNKAPGTPTGSFRF